jgi:hypothetical protein
MPRLATLTATLALALAVAILMQPLIMLRLLTGFELSTLAATSRDAWMVVAVLRVCAALLIVVAALLMALRGAVVASRAARQTIGTGLAAGAVVLLAQAQAIFGTPAAWLFGGSMALIGLVFLVSARATAPRPA